MEHLTLSSTVERTVDKRLRVSWMKRTIPLKSSTLFNKAKHSEDWHQSVEATAGVLAPSDPKFPYALLHNHTAVYLQKKGKISQADADIRLAILIDANEARDIAVAAAAHAMSAKSLRALLTAQLNVAQGSYWGLETWLQCLIAANYGNPASVTDLETLWARMILPYATHGMFAAGSYLKGVTRALRKVSIPNLHVLPEFLVLVRRAIADYSAQLEGLRLRSQWAAAHDAVFWMMEMESSSPAVTPPGHLLPEHIFDSQFPVWRLWATWRPDLNRISRIASSDRVGLSTIPDLMALDGPDVLTGTQSTLREGLIAQYGSAKPWVRFGSLVIEVPDRTKIGLKNTLERLAKGLDTILARKPSDSGCESMFRLFRDTVNQPITKKGLDIFESTLKITYTPENDIYNTVRIICLERDSLCGQHVLALQRFIRVLDEPQAEDLRIQFLCPWFHDGVILCIRECLVAVRAHMDRALPWTHLALEAHAFCSIVKNSKLDLSAIAPDMKSQLDLLPPVEQLRMILEIYTAAQGQQSKPLKSLPRQDTCFHTEDADKQCSAHPKEVEETRHPLEAFIESFCILRLLQPGEINHTTQRTVSAILHVWESTAEPPVDKDRRSLAIFVSKSTGDDDILRCRCLAEIAQGSKILKAPDFVKDLLTIMIQADSAPVPAIIALTKLLADKNDQTQCWKDLLYMWLGQNHDNKMDKSTAVIEYSLRNMRAAEWLCFIHSLETLFTDLNFSNSEERRKPSILQPQLSSWVTQVSRYTGTLAKLEGALEDLEAVRCILLCGEGFWKKNFLRILDFLERAEGKPAEKMMQKLVGKLSAKSKNAWEVRECLYHLLNATPGCIQVCEKIWNASHGFLVLPGLAVHTQVAERPVSSRRTLVEKVASIRSTTSSQPAASNQPTPRNSQYNPTPVEVSKVDVPPSVAEIIAAGWIQSNVVDAIEKAVVESVALLLQIEVYKNDIPTEKLLEAAIFWESIEKGIIEEAEHLEGLQKALKIQDPRGTSMLLEELGIPDNSLLDEELMNLPAGLIDLVERVGDKEVELSFALTTSTELQRGAMGMPKAANTLLLRLFVDHIGDLPPSFCVHFNNDDDLDTLEHSPWICSQNSKSPQDNVCKSVQTAFTWQLNRLIHTQLRIGNIGIADLYRLVKKRLEELGQLCISCGASHNAKNAHLRRSTPCDIMSCARLWYQLPLDVRIPEIRADTFAVDMMLTSVYAAAMSNKSELLPGCPIYGNELVKTILNSLPSLTVLSHAVNLSTVLKSYHKDAEKLISWACVQFRGYLATATGICKIPNLPTGTHQFVLVNASPRLESDFVSRLPRYNPKTTVLFHGTSLDRLPAILAQGLRICSGTSLQRTGAAHGKGIYMAEDPATSFTYSPASLSWRNSGLPNMRLLLGCEVVGNGRSVSSGIHVLTDERSVMVRYVFLFTNYAASPVASHIIPAMASGMAALRSGAV
ncbi:Nn.00g078240.m01.CDS01 [Neocucurbitaria sp. VM-36]